MPAARLATKISHAQIVQVVEVEQELASFLADIGYS
jgi:hypothetical protein